MNLSASAQAKRVSNRVAAGQGTVETDHVDMLGFRAVEFTIALGTVLAGATITAKLQGSLDGGVNFEDLADASVVLDDQTSNQLAILDAIRPKHTHLRCAVIRSDANVQIDSVVARLYQADNEPVSHDTTVAKAEIIASPVAA